MNTNQDCIKTGAKRMCDQLASKGVKVTHTAMLEALATGLGLDNWRTLKAVIDAPRAGAIPAIPAKPVLPALGQQQTWMVSALYLDNHQQYGDSYQGRTPLEAAVNALLERLTDGGLDIGILDVSNANNESCLNPSRLSEIQLTSNYGALAAVLTVVDKAEGTSWTHEQGLARAWLRTVMAECTVTQLQDLIDSCAFDIAKVDANDPVALEETLTPTEALDLLCDLGEELLGGVLKLEAENLGLATNFHHVRGLTVYFPDILNDVNVGGIAEMYFDFPYVKKD